MYQFTRTEQEAPDNIEGHRSFQSCGVFSVELAYCETSGAKNLRVAPGVLENLLTPCE